MATEAIGENMFEALKPGQPRGVGGKKKKSSSDKPTVTDTSKVSNDSDGIIDSPAEEGWQKAAPKPRSTKAPREQAASDTWGAFAPKATNGFKTSNKRQSPRSSNDAHVPFASPAAPSASHQAKGGARGVSSQVIDELNNAVIPVGKSRTVFLQKWLERMSGDGSDKLYADEGRKWTFQQLFLKSEAFDHLIESLLTNPVSDEEIPIIFKIFKECLEGPESVLQSLMDGVFRVASELAARKDSPVMSLVKTFPPVIAAYKKHVSVEERMIEEIQHVDEMLATKKARLDELEASDNGPRTCAERARCTTDLLHLCKSKMKAIHACQADMKTPEHLSRVFETTEERVSLVSRESSSSVEQLIFKKREIELEREQKKMEFETSIRDMHEESSYKDKKKNELLERKKTLEEELRQVNAQLAEIGASRGRGSLQRSKHEAEFDKLQKDLEKREQDLAVRIARRQDDNKAIDAAMKFVEIAKKNIHYLPKVDKCSVDFDLLTVRTGEDYLNASWRHLLIIKESMDLFCRRLSFCSEKLVSMRLEQKQYSDLGMSKPASSLESAITQVEQERQAENNNVQLIFRDAQTIREGLSSFRNLKQPRLDDLIRRVDGLLRTIEVQKNQVS